MENRQRTVGKQEDKRALGRPWNRCDNFNLADSVRIRRVPAIIVIVVKP
jgi:hypothetical protein